MIVIFLDPALKQLYEEGKSKKYKAYSRDARFLGAFQEVINTLRGVESTNDLPLFSFLHYEQLKHQGDDPKSSVRIMNGRVERLIFRELDGGIEIEIIELDDTHYGNKK